MSIAAIINALTDAAEGVRSEYRPGTKDEGTEGKFVLDVTSVDGFTLENVASLKSALGTERGEVQRLSGVVKAFDGLDAVDVKKKLGQLDELLKIDPKTEADKIANEKIEAAKTQLIAQHQTELAAANAKADKLSKGYINRTFDKHIGEALEGLDVLNPEALKLKLRSAMKIKDTGNDDDPYTVEIVDAAGNPMIGNSQGGAMTPKMFAEALKKDPAWATSFKPEGKPGTDAKPGNPGGGGKTIARTAFDALTPAEKVAQMGAGVTVIDG